MTRSTNRPESPGRQAAGRWLRILAVNAAGAVLVTLMLALLGGGGSLGATLVVALIFANSIGTPAALVLPPLTRRLCQRGRAVQWLGLLAALLALAAAGSLLASLIVIAVRLVPPAEFWPLVSFSLKIALLVTLGIGVSMFFYESTRARLDRTTLELRARELEQERADKLLTEARLAALEARLHPHFLFNTLNAIAALIPEEPERAERLVERLSELLRFSLDLSGRGTVALEKELEIVEAYLEIQGARLGDRLRYRIEVPEALWPLPVPPLALHTLVENSVTHVAAERREGAEVRVTGKLLDGRPVLEVWDDGPGFRLDRIPPGRGLDTLRSRLAALFGARAGLEVARRNGGTSVALSLPAEGAP